MCFSCPKDPLNQKVCSLSKGVLCSLFTDKQTGTHEKEYKGHPVRVLRTFLPIINRSNDIFSELAQVSLSQNAISNKIRTHIMRKKMLSAKMRVN